MIHVNRRQMTIFMLSIVATIKFAATKIVVAPKDVDAVHGTSAIFNCSTSILQADVQWVHTPIDKSPQTVYGYKKFHLTYANKCTLVDGHNLKISSVTVDDAGTYECQDDYGQGERRNAELTVLESNPTCRSSSNLNKIIGNNTCGIEPDRVILTCSVQYQGKKAPALEWTKIGEEQTISSGVVDEVRGNWVLTNLTLKGDSIVNGSSFSCRSAKSTSASVTCDSITIEGVSLDCESCQNCNVAIICICTVFSIVIAFSVLSLIAFSLFNFMKKKNKKRSPQLNLEMEGQQLRVKEISENDEQHRADSELLISRSEDHESSDNLNHLIQDYEIASIKSPTPENRKKRRSEISSKVAYGVSNDRVKGRVVVISNEHFVNLPIREGTEHDLKNLRCFFEDKLNFIVDIHLDLCAKEIEEQLELESKNLVGFDIFILFVLSFGIRGEVYGIDCETVRVDDILAQFDGERCPEFAGKPKLFFVQAGMGAYHLKEIDSKGMNNERKGAPPEWPFINSKMADTIKNPKKVKVGLHLATNVMTHVQADVAVIYSAVDDDSIRTMSEGSYFVRSLLTVFIKKSHEEDVMSMVTQALGLLHDLNFERRLDKATTVKIRQLGYIAGTLHKKLYFLL